MAPSVAALLALAVAAAGLPSAARAAEAAPAASVPVIAGEAGAIGLGSAAPAVGTDWRTGIGVFKAGLVRGWSADMSPAMLARLERSLSAALGLPVRVVTFERFTSLVDAQVRGQIDYAAYSARAFAAGQIACECLTPVARPTSALGATGQRVHLVADPSRWAGLSAVPAGRLGWVGGDATAAAAMVRDALRLAGQAVQGDEEFWLAFPTAAAARAAFAAGQVDGYVVTGGDTGDAARDAREAVAAESARLAADGAARPVIAAWSSPGWAYGPHAVRSALAPEARKLIADWLATLDVRDPPLHALLADGLAGPFRPAADADYRAVRRAVQRMAGTF